MSDIRSFFGIKTASGTVAPAATKPAPKEDPTTARKKRSRKVVDDSDEDDFEPQPSPRNKPVKKQPKEEAKGEPTSTSDYFASSKKRGRPPKNAEAKDTAPATPSPVENGSSTPKAKQSKETPASTGKNAASRASKPVLKVLDNDEGLGGDDIFATEYSKSGRRDDDYVDDNDASDSDDLIVKPATSRRSKPDDDDMEMLDTPPKSKPGRKRKTDAAFDADEDDKKPKKSTGPAVKKQKSAAKLQEPENKEIQDIFDAIPTVRPPTPPPTVPGEKPKFNFAAAGRSRTPPAAGSAEIPVGAENCLAGLSFVFTGVLDSLGREEGQSLVKRYGGKVTGAPSSKTSYVVLGSDAGPSKLRKIKEMNIKTIGEEGLFELIRRLPANGGSGKAAGQAQAKKEAEEKKIRAMAEEMEQEEKQKAAEAKARRTPQKSAATTPASSQPQFDDRLWTTKYAPSSLNMICGNKGQVEKLQTWLRNWRLNAKRKFKMAGKDGSGLYRSVMIHGPPGIGKTTAAHLVAKLEGYDVVETNASDTRSKKLVEGSLLGVLDTTSLQGYFSSEGKNVESQKKNLVLIMDEVDGMSAGDRGGVGALAAAAKKTNIPLILICNERSLPKMKPFDHVTYELPFRRPTAEMIRARLMTICFREGLKIPPPVLDSLIAGTNADIRQLINMLSTVKLDQKTLDFDQGKQLSKAWEKHIILKPWDIASKILNAQTFSQSSKLTLNDKIELYFNDHEFSYLMLQENYLKTQPTLASNYPGKERKLKLLELADNAASSISDGDLVDRMIHGSQQQWSLMPTHAVFSFVRPASFIFGNMMERTSFTSWLGNNSKYGKLNRYTKEIQGHMRLRASGDRDEIRQQYLPALWDKMVRPLMVDGKDAVEDVIDLMDSYFITREDFDSIVELGLGPMSESVVDIHTQTKSAFTRIYNQRSHPLPFMKATNVLAPKKGPKVKPDIEDAIEDSDEEEVVDDAIEEDEEEELDLKKDKYVKVPKAKKAATKGTAKSKKAKAKNDNDEDDEEEKPKKGRKGKAKAK
ncbi:DNA replication factor C complex subunit Rfc1 [Talaromyces marneffei ATCC 18224]|uniref:Replication factor C subunit 1 n=1 Tax=Talaromyces marneffei (strain ATCC 18224 / CBS 334.59 / QM 7333) TaxID=441960 RepID=B6QGV2_TALMQ|nr:DNA replication factor C subunit Rfc1, putative [Talaromyces marneffei ATCC 18224]KAE8551500.1 hypothetical protein EYB25_005390 [Talaromyces marneffei]